MNISLLGWSSTGLRCPDAEIWLTKSGERNDGVATLPKVALVQMPNGTGKTTTLKLIQACLTNAAETWSESEIRELRSLKVEGREGQFLLHLQVGNSKVSFEISFDFVAGSGKYRTSSPETNGFENGWRPPSDVRRYLNSDFINLVIFDGEYANRLLDQRQTKADDAIDALCQLDLFDLIASEAKLRWDNEKSQGAPNAREIRDIQTALAAETEARKRCAEEIAQLKSAIATADQRMQGLKAEILSEIKKSEDARKAYELAGRQTESARVGYDNTLSQLMSKIRDPSRISNRINDVLHAWKKKLDKAQLPQASSKQFFEEIAQESECICGRPMTAEAQHAIMERSGSYLGSETNGILNEIKGAIDKYAVQHADAKEFINAAAVEAYEKQGAYERAKTTEEQAKRKIEKEAGEEVQNMRTESTTLELKITTGRRALDMAEKKLVESKKKEEELDARLAKALNAQNLFERIKILKTICEDAKESSRSKIRATILDECNKRLKTILKDNPVQVERIDNAIVLSKQREASVGQTLAVGYTFLTALFAKATHAFPLVVDSPANAIDLRVRDQIGRLIPTLCKQFVAFTISSEREGFVPALEQGAAGDVLYMTVYRDKSAKDNKAVVNKGKQEFFSFHRDTE